MPDPASPFEPGSNATSRLNEVTSCQAIDSFSKSSEAAPLDCETFEFHVQELLDLKRNPQDEPSVQQHASTCPECHELLRQFSQLELTLQLALRKNSSDSKRGSEHLRPFHPVSQIRRRQAGMLLQAVAVLLLTGSVGGWLASRQSERAPRMPLATSNESSPASRAQRIAGINGIQPAVHYRSLEQCYELTSELPGVRPLQSSIQVAIAWWWNYLNLDGNGIRTTPHHERGFGLNPLLAEVHRQV
jgi:hypothetical protein